MCEQNNAAEKNLYRPNAKDLGPHAQPQPHRVRIFSFRNWATPCPLSPSFTEGRGTCLNNDSAMGVSSEHKKFRNRCAAVLRANGGAIGLSHVSRMQLPQATFVVGADSFRRCTRQLGDKLKQAGVSIGRFQTLGGYANTLRFTTSFWLPT